MERDPDNEENDNLKKEHFARGTPHDHRTIAGEWRALAKNREPKPDLMNRGKPNNNRHASDWLKELCLCLIIATFTVSPSQPIKSIGRTITPIYLS
jgi:hypothetical protein